ncbi:MAG TPA: hypothetical protein VM532_06365 [Burkholderiales bacterium]|nr:hypothetical protein [Burkholderiales bacterium]
MDGYIQYNITDASFEEFVAFLFNHEVIPVPKNGKKEPEPWYWKAEVTFEPIRVSCDYVRLFTNPEFLLSNFSVEQLDQGFWAIQSSNIECSVADIIWHRHVPFVMRANCIRSMFYLFEKLFATTSLGTAPHMWWDSLAYDWCCGNRSRLNGGEDEQMQDVMFETLEKILALPSSDCQAAALHGLGHLHHPETQQLIDQYIRLNEIISPELRDYAHAAARFDVM